jgi:endonuclease YncB( thermonuclease family)
MLTCCINWVGKNLQIKEGLIVKKLLALLLIVPALVVAQGKMPKNSATYDDTIVIAAPFLPQPLKPELAVRIFGVDTPEKGHRAQCPSEDTRGQAASEFTKNVVKSTKRHQVILYGWDKFGGRVLGDMILDGVSLRAELIRNGFAREYYGDAKQSWCQ